MVNLLTVGFLKGGNGAPGEIGVSGTFCGSGGVWLLTGR
jgi:hypothetical protein